MGIQDITAVFGRYFIVGFFLPSFFWLSYLKLAAGEGLLPKQVEKETAAAFAIVGIAALALGLLLQGVRSPLERLLSGYYLLALWRSSRKPRLKAAAELVRRLSRWKALREYERIAARAEPRGARRPGEADDRFRDRRLAEYQLERRFPNRREKVLPTKFGNRIRAWEDYARERWSLETVAIGPHVESLLAAEEIELRRDAETDVAFALNGCLLGLAIGVTVGVDRAIETPGTFLFLLVCLAPLLLALALYELAVVAAVRWGDVVRAGIDLHRLELYDRLALRRPRTEADDRAVGPALNRMLLYGEVIPDDARAAGPTDANPPQSERSPGIGISAVRLVVLGLALASIAGARRWMRDA